ncbi:ATP-dependent DNA helicase [Infirmifilum lucidum]|uniref:ATP-dependent DNA helicase n=1 Tax=Infirmifilum lucidum TaxID=2776706 RepID=A0A7L9FI93_9CREN|nr:ATP-dependent DNA helicase [Infirmifilum lucidum]QOJ78743.1 ATP-dependent DNA helicase [Infirmifilum lucidum]
MEARFPYKPRRHQLEVAGIIREQLRRRNVVLEAPTGFGKTPVVIYALLPFLERGGRVVWTVRTGNETDRPVEEFRVFRERSGVKLVALSLRGKRDMCLLARRFGDNLDYDDVSYICSREKNRCPYYRRLREGVNLQPFIDAGALTYTYVYEKASALGVCPYFLQRELLKVADVVALSYNYVVDEGMSWSIRTVFPFKESILVVDEAHNLQNLNLGGDTITEGTMERAYSEALEIGDSDSAELVRYTRERVKEKYSGLQEEESEVFDPEELLPQGFEDTLENALRSGEAIREKRFREGKRPQSSLYHFASFFKAAVEAEGIDGIALVVERNNGRLHLSIWDMRAGEILSEVWKSFKRVIFMSGTLTPLEAFAETVGLEDYYPISVPSPYDETNASVYLVRDLTTRGEELSDEMAEKYVRAIAKTLGRVRRNTAVFTASYRIQNKLLEKGLVDTARSLGYTVFLERREMSGVEAHATLQRFKSLAETGSGLLVAPMGGRFAEGADYPGEELMCVFLVGVPFEKPTTKTRLYIEYYQRLYGEEKGRLYAYVYPAIRKASQAIGRALRGPRDQAVIVLGDYRYQHYMPLMPDYVRELAKPITHDTLDSIEPPWERIRL